MNSEVGVAVLQVFYSTLEKQQIVEVAKYEVRREISSHRSRDNNIIGVADLFLMLYIIHNFCAKIKRIAYSMCIYIIPQ